MGVVVCAMMEFIIVHYKIKRTKASSSINLCKTLEPPKSEEALKGKTLQPTKVYLYLTNLAYYENHLKYYHVINVIIAFTIMPYCKNCE